MQRNGLEHGSNVYLRCHFMYRVAKNTQLDKMQFLSNHIVGEVSLCDYICMYSSSFANHFDYLCHQRQFCEQCQNKGQIGTFSNSASQLHTNQDS